MLEIDKIKVCKECKIYKDKLEELINIDDSISDVAIDMHYFIEGCSMSCEKFAKATVEDK